MATSSRLAKRAIERLLSAGSVEEIVERLRPVSTEEIPLPAEVPEGRHWSNQATATRHAFLAERLGLELPGLSGRMPLGDDGELRGNIEGYIGMTQIPTGVIGPVRINGADAHGDFYVPMATTEGALVASYNRGAAAAARSGGVTAICLNEAVQRAPCFTFRTFTDAGMFLVWSMTQIELLGDVVAGRSSHARLEEVRPNIDGNQLTLVLEFTTGDAAGQNMVTLCSEAICRHLVEHAPIRPLEWYVEGNLSGDKKATAMSFTSVRGKKVTAEATIRRDLVTSILRTTPEAMLAYWKTSVLNGVQSGSIGVNGHFANGIAALFLACGQDVACVSEASVGITRFDIDHQGDLYVSVSLPNLIVGTVGGGTWLPTQRDCLSMIGCLGNGKARRFAEICGAVILGGELSIVAAIAAGDFARAHAMYGRRN